MTFDKNKYKIDYKRDCINGSKLELELLDRIKEYYDDQTIKATSRYHKFDYISENKLIELKNINAPGDKYKNLMIMKSKLEYASEYHPNKEVYFIFNFIDCIKEFKYTDQQPTYKKFFQRRDRGINEVRHEYYYFPSDQMKNINL